MVTERSVEPNSAPTFAPVYAGATEDLSNLFGSHEKSDCFQMYYANTVAVALPPMSVIVPHAVTRLQSPKNLTKNSMTQNAYGCS